MAPISCAREETTTMRAGVPWTKSRSIKLHPFSHSLLHSLLIDWPLGSPSQADSLAQGPSWFMRWSCRLSQRRHASLMCWPMGCRSRSNVTKPRGSLGHSAPSHRVCESKAGIPAPSWTAEAPWSRQSAQNGLCLRASDVQLQCEHQLEQNMHLSPCSRHIKGNYSLIKDSMRSV